MAKYWPCGDTTEAHWTLQHHGQSSKLAETVSEHAVVYGRHTHESCSRSQIVGTKLVLASIQRQQYQKKSDPSTPVANAPKYPRGIMKSIVHLKACLSSGRLTTDRTLGRTCQTCSKHCAFLYLFTTRRALASLFQSSHKLLPHLITFSIFCSLHVHFYSLTSKLRIPRGASGDGHTLFPTVVMVIGPAHLLLFSLPFLQTSA